MKKFALRAAAGMAALDRFYNAGTGLWQTTGWWNCANALETTVDYCARTGDTAYAGRIANTYEKNGAKNFLNDFYDDEGWWALAWIKAYDLTNDARYLNMAATIFADVTRGWDATCGGGIWWNKAHAKKNAIANELFLSVAARLAARSTEGGAPYLDWAERAWAWFRSSGLINGENLINDGLTAACVNDGGVTWTYNQGVILGALAALYECTGDESLLTQAQAIADAALERLTDENGVLHEPNEPNLGVDGPQFKGIFMRNLCDLYAATAKHAYGNAILANARAIWSLDRNEGNALGALWAGPFDRGDASRQSAAMDAVNGAVLFDVDGVTYQAENGQLQDLSTEANYAGYHGSGYVAGWNKEGQSVALAVDVPSSAPYDLMFRYAAIGDAVRSLFVNGALFAQLRFPRTGSWTTWSTTELFDVPLSAGNNIISVSFVSANASQGWLNLDELTIF